MDATIGLYEAISAMRNLTTDRVPFSIRWMSYNSSSNTSAGMKEIKSCFLRKAASAEVNERADMMLYLWNVDTKENRKCYKPLLMYFNGLKIKV
jgi:hypothetical protein